jgi:hypothetical protein
MTTQLHDAHSIPLEAIDVSDPQLYQDDAWYPHTRGRQGVARQPANCL